MNTIPPYLYSAALIALAFASWPILANASKTPAAWVGILVLIGTVIGNLAVGLKDLRMSPFFTLESLTIMLVAGIVNGVAVYFYGAKSADPAIPTWVFVASINVLMVVSALVLSSVITWSLPSLRQVAGVILAGIAIYLITGK